MDKDYLSGIVKNLIFSVEKRSPEILMGLGITGILTTGVMVAVATTKALKIVRMEETRKQSSRRINYSDQTSYQLTKKEVVKLTWRFYIAPAIMGTTSLACIIGASSVNSKRNAALATAYTLSETALKEYKETVIETIGEKKEQQVQDAVIKKRMDKTPFVNNEIIITEKGNTLCFDFMTGRFFRSDIDKIRKIINELNDRLRKEMYVSLNDFYYEVGLDSVKLGDDLGWDIDDGYIEVSYSSQLSKDETPCLVIDYTVRPRYNYCN